MLFELRGLAQRQTRPNNVFSSLECLELCKEPAVNTADRIALDIAYKEIRSTKAEINR